MTKILVMTKNKYLSLGSIYIIDISIYLDLPARGTDREIERETKREKERQIDR